MLVIAQTRRVEPRRLRLHQLGSHAGLTSRHGMLRNLRFNVWKRERGRVAKTCGRAPHTSQSGVRSAPASATLVGG